MDHDISNHSTLEENTNNVHDMIASVQGLTTSAYNMRCGAFQFPPKEWGNGGKGETHSPEP
ncbi:hypothetical protein GBA52_025849 [Prunus armeniaca]|nr:hypothetical protein GBA52_025425 [Prunus armeniaca]KAH0973693.1 hypothetical protein GBA52_025849 [Prunus armeniaca]